MWTIASCFVFAIVSALLPWVNAELLLLAVAAPLTSAADLMAVVLAVTAGQVGGKSVLWIAREVPGKSTGRIGARGRPVAAGEPAANVPRR
jgi:hypothetical protein